MEAHPGPFLHPETSRPALSEPDERAGWWDGGGRLVWDAGSHPDGLTEVITYILALLLEAMGIPGGSTRNKIWRLWGMTARRLSRPMDLSRSLASRGMLWKTFRVVSGAWCARGVASFVG